MMESKISLPLYCCSIGAGLLYILRYFTELALLYYRSPMLIIAAIVAILQEVLMIFHKFNICRKNLPAGKGAEK